MMFWFECIVVLLYVVCFNCSVLLVVNDCLDFVVWFVFGLFVYVFDVCLCGCLLLGFCLACIFFWFVLA